MDERLVAALNICANNPEQRGPWIELAQQALNQRDYLTGYWAASKGLEIRQPANDLEHQYFNSWPYDLLGTCAYYVGLYNASRDAYIEAWRIYPNDSRLINNVKFVRRHLHEFTIHILWPTVRPDTFKERIQEWFEKACNEDKIRVKVAVNTKAQQRELQDFTDVMVIGSDRRGVAYASYRLAQACEGLPGDIVILASDDFYPPKDWDAWIYEHMNDFHGCLVVNDADNPPRTHREGVVTIPIMDYGCLKLLNKIIYHPSYCHLYSDNELFDNLNELKLIKNLQQPNQPVFEHRHWYHGKRDKDIADNFVHENMERDKQNYHNRHGMKLQDKLVYQT